MQAGCGLRDPGAVAPGVSLKTAASCCLRTPAPHSLMLAKIFSTNRSFSRAAGLVATGLPYHLRGSLRLVAHAGASADDPSGDAHNPQGHQPASQQVSFPSNISKTSSNTGTSSSSSSSNSSTHHPGGYAWHHYDTIDKHSGAALSWNEVTRAVDAARGSLARKQKHAGGKPASLTLEFDLRGVHFDLRSASSNTPGPNRDTLLLRPGLTLRLANGAISSDSLSLLAGPGSSLQLCNMRISSGEPGLDGVVVVEGAGASATLEHSTISMSRSDNQLRARFAEMPADASGYTGSGWCCAVKVSEGATATLNRCVLQGARNIGLVVRGAGSSTTATACTVRKCGGSGISSQKGALLMVQQCTAQRNGANGFLAVGAKMEVGPYCTADNNGHGFLVAGQAYLLVRAGATATGNSGSGFTAYGPGSLLEAGEECISSGNALHGFSAYKGGQLWAHDSCAASNNGGTGFLAARPGSQLFTGMASTAAYNTGSGFAATDGGHLIASKGSAAIHNHAGDFTAMDDGSCLAAHSECVAQYNGDHGFASLAGAVLLAGAACLAHSNKGAGFTAQAAGHLAAVEGLLANAHSADGFSAAGEGAQLLYGPNCVAFSNGSSNLRDSGDWVEAGGGSVRPDPGAVQATDPSQ